ncbi:hypothetical protein [Hydrogenophaga sp.]|uniref:hypothetical protein n=1 Tax=Hydrogenophaga sp. TaxID=1904254 RepID=UPI002FC79CB8
MDTRHHFVTGFFATVEEARQVRDALIKRGLPADHIDIHQDQTPAGAAAPDNDSNAVLKDMVVDGAVGTAVGTGIGALAQVALVAANVSLFIASPLLAPLVMMGWGASIGAVVGAAMGAVADPTAKPKDREGWLSELVTDAIASGQVVLVARTEDEGQTAIAREVISASVGDVKDVAAT